MNTTAQTYKLDKVVHHQYEGCFNVDLISFEIRFVEGQRSNNIYNLRKKNVTDILFEK